MTRIDANESRKCSIAALTIGTLVLLVSAGSMLAGNKEPGFILGVLGVSMVVVGILYLTDVIRYHRPKK